MVEHIDDFSQIAENTSLPKNKRKIGMVAVNDTMFMQQVEKCAYCPSTNICKYGGNSEPICYKCAGHELMEGTKGETFLRISPKLQRNDKCSCGSGKKYKKCCINK